MKTNKITLYFFLVISIVMTTLLIAFYLFSMEKENASQETIQIYRENSVKLIADRVYEDLLLDNLLEASRKLNLLKESGIIDKFKIIKNDQKVDTQFKYCEPIYFDKNLKNIKWGNVCVNFLQTPNENKIINLSRMSLIFISIIIFIIFLILFIFRQIRDINNLLYTEIENVVRLKNKYNFEKSFWSPVLYELNKLVIENKSAEEKIVELKIESEKIELANQVAHDIRSPLAALEQIDLSKLSNIEDSTLAKNAIRRLKGIAELLLEQGRASKTEKNSEININLLLNNFLKQKKVEFEDRKIILKPIPDNVYVKGDEIILESILSNIVNNAIEASDLNSKVIISAQIIQNNIELTINDQGKGIPSELLSKFGKEKITHGKPSGNGLGVFHAIQKINSWNGSIKFDSKIDHGTTVTITLQISQKVQPTTTNVLIDNDELVCLTWEARSRKAGVPLRIFKTSIELFSNLSLIPLETTFYIDSELDSEKGEDLAKKLYDLGYHNLIMCSGHSSEKFEHLAFIKKTIGKTPPF